jgi:hypothetical protein
MCVGFYKITSSPTIDVKDVKMLYNDIPNKNEIIINSLIGTQYKKSRL